MSDDNTIRYKDLYFRLIVPLIAAHIIVSFGERFTLSELLLMPAYYISVLVSFLIAFILVSIVRWLTILLDKRCDWIDSPLQRTILQILLVIVLPGVAAFLLAAIYFSLQGINILDTVYLRLDFPVIMLMLVLLNLYYLAYYFYLRLKMQKSAIGEGTLSNVITIDKKSKAVFLVNSGTKNIPVPVEEIGYFYRRSELNYLRTRESKDYMISQSLDDVEKLLDDRQFFRVNRQVLVNFKACLNFEILPFGKLQLFVTPELKQAIIISQKRAKQFREWVER